MNMHAVNQTIGHNDPDGKEYTGVQHENHLMISHY